MVCADLDLLDVAAPPSLRAGSSVHVSPGGTVSLDDSRIGRLPSPTGRAATGRVRTLRRDGETVVGVTVRLDERKEPAAAAAAAPAVPPPRGLHAAAEAALDPDELACRLSKPELDALAASSGVRASLSDPAVRAAAQAVLSSPNPAAALEAATAPGGALASLADAVLDVVEPDT